MHVCVPEQPICVLAGCHRKRLNQGLVVGFSVSVREGMFLCYVFLVSRCMLCLVRCLLVSVPVQLIVWKIRLGNDVIRVEWDVKPY